MATRVWNPIMLVHVYRMVRVGVEVGEIAKTLGISRQRLTQWRKEKPELGYAWSMAEKERDEHANLSGWIFERLSAPMQEVWKALETIHAESEETNVSPVEAIEKLFLDGGRAARQELFLYALCVENFSPSHAMRKVNLTKRELDNWLTDPHFAGLVEEIQWHKANFFEHSLVQLVREGVPAAILFANKTFNRERGYAQRVEVTGNVNVTHGVLDLEELGDRLSPACRTELLDAIRRMREEKARVVSQPTVIESIGYQAAESVS